MKTAHLLEYLRCREGELIARFGQAELVRYPNGRYELSGGSVDDHRAAREWISMFLHEAVVSL